MTLAHIFTVAPLVSVISSKNCPFLNMTLFLTVLGLCWEGGQRGRGYIYIADLLCCTAETNATAEKFMQYQLDVISYEVLNTRFHFVSIFTVVQSIF